MNKEILYEALLSPTRVGDVPRDELERVAREYPYFNSAQVLLARSYRQTGDHRFSDQLQVASQTSGDRLSLYHLLKENTSEIPVQKIPEAKHEIPSIKTETPAPVLEPQEAKQAVIETPIPVAPPKQEPVFVAPTVVRPTLVPAAKSEPVTESAVSHQPVVVQESTEKVRPEEATTDQEKPVRDALEEAILARAVSSSIEIEVGEEMEETEIENAEIETEEAEFPATSESEEPENEDSFAAWVAKRAKDIGYQEDKSNSSRLPVYNESAQPRLKPSENKKKTQQELIDRFIQTNPRIQPGKSEEYDLENIARTSITEDLTVVSETMAVLLASQGKKEKARRVYRKLMELHPEKSVYFAAQLKNLDKLK